MPYSFSHALVVVSLIPVDPWFVLMFLHSMQLGVCWICLKSNLIALRCGSRYFTSVILDDHDSKYYSLQLSLKHRNRKFLDVALPTAYAQEKYYISDVKRLWSRFIWSHKSRIEQRTTAWLMPALNYCQFYLSSAFYYLVTSNNYICRVDGSPLHQASIAW